ncbi:hypothetical protein Tco_0352296 [Tanacetum coccineum]
MENFGWGPYANMKTEWASNPYLDVNCIFGRDYEASNVGDTQENQGHKEHKGNINLEPSNCKIRRFKMMKYSFDDDEEYITIKESEYLNHSKDSLDAYRELLCLNGVTRLKKYAELLAAEKIQADCDRKATNIILQGLPAHIYSLVNHHRVAKDLWERVQLLMQGTSLTKQERECKLYDAFDKFTHIKGESLHNLPPEWIKFVTDVKLVKDLHTTNFDQLYAYLEQNKLYANEVRLLHERNQDPLACVANQQMTPPHFTTYQSSYNNPQLQQ